jgi:hypothetical protein
MGMSAIAQLAWGSCKLFELPGSRLVVVYTPPLTGLPFLALILSVDGTTTAMPFDTADEAAAYNKLIAGAYHPGASALAADRNQPRRRPLT